jgi:hypothetical protein
LDIKNPKKEGFLGFWGRFPSFFHFPPFFPLLAIENEKTTSQPLNPSHFNNNNNNNNKMTNKNKEKQGKRGDGL